MNSRSIVAAMMYMLSLIVVQDAPGEILYVAFDDPVGDHTGLVDVVHMGVAFDSTNGDYVIVLTASSAHPFQGDFRININLFNPDTGTTARIPSFFPDQLNDYSLAVPVTAITLVGTNNNLLSWENGDRVATTHLPFGNPDGSSAFRTAVGSFPLNAWRLNEDIIAEGGFATIRLHSSQEMPRISATICVDDDAPNDPGPNDSAVSDLAEDGSREHPFDMIQEGIDAAEDGDTVLVYEGMYHETIELNGKEIEVTSFDPEGDAMHAYPVIDAGYAGTVVTFDQDEGGSCRLSGFVLTRGFGGSVSSSADGTISGDAGAIACIGTSPHIKNCIIIGNRCADPEDSSLLGAVVYCVNSDALFENCTIADNYAGAGGAGFYSVESHVAISNCIIWNNVPNEIAIPLGDAPIVSYTNTLGGWPGFGNVDVEPAFAFPGYWADLNDLKVAVEPDHPDAMWLDGDYHLLSRAGRWDPIEEDWILDETPSPCIDAGDPESVWENETEPNGGRINLGAYGGTSQASMTSIDCSLTITATEGGRVILPGIVEPGQTRTFYFDCGETATIVVEPDPDHYFIGWGPDSSLLPIAVDANGLTFTVAVTSSDTALVPVYTRRPEAAPGGSIEFPDGPPSVFDAGAGVRILAKPDPCYHFTGWTGTAVDAGKVADPNAADTTVHADADYTLIANFAPDEPSTLTISSGNGGSVTDPGEGVFAYDCGDAAAAVRAVPESCYHFVGWSGTAVDANKVAEPDSAETMVTVDDDYTLIAHFELRSYDLTVTSSKGGSVTVPGEDTFQYECGTPVAVTATPAEYAEFAGWSGTAVDAGRVADPNNASTTVTVDADYTLQANFAMDQHTVTFSSTNGGYVNLTVSVDDTSYSWLDERTLQFDHGTRITLTAMAEPGYEFTNWSGTIWSTADYLFFDVEEDYELTANFGPASEP